MKGKKEAWRWMLRALALLTSGGSKHNTTEIPSQFKTVQGRSSFSEKTASVNCFSSSFGFITANYPESVFKNEVDFDHSRRAT